ncbi:hypothetical protein SteCoe_15459 [Stentor coeruleus]|uniref:Uncharacterized protein n=1 Tax=Stentor coeruleus TaxID=5963 RepID=A0A1R2C3U7_9CILI|nr:hypothetical protein SteCoe_15459 [Stentor coeruleus]
MENFQRFQNLDIQYLKSERESLIKSNYAYSEKIGIMEIEISDLKAMLQALQNENKALSFRLLKTQEAQNTNNKQEALEKVTKELEKLKELQASETSAKKAERSDEVEDLTEEVTELKEELRYLKGEYIPKLENQLENARLLIIELESEITHLNNEKERNITESSFAGNGRKNSVGSAASGRKEFLQPYSEGEYLKEEKPYSGQKPRARPQNYMPSIKRFDKNNKTPEFKIQISKQDS